jgi:hypothetical protein
MVTMDRPPSRTVTPHKRVVTARRLAELHGPGSGVIELPHRLLWQADRHVNLDNPALLRWAYQIVLREAVTVEELRTWLDGETLIRVWPDLYLPRWVRRAWQEQHPELAAQARASRPKLSA